MDSHTILCLVPWFWSCCRAVEHSNRPSPLEFCKLLLQVFYSGFERGNVTGTQLSIPLANPKQSQSVQLTSVPFPAQIDRFLRYIRVISRTAHKPCMLVVYRHTMKPQSAKFTIKMVRYSRQHTNPHFGASASRARTDRATDTQQRRCERWFHYVEYVVAQILVVVMHTEVLFEITCKSVMTREPQTTGPSSNPRLSPEASAG